MQSRLMVTHGKITHTPDASCAICAQTMKAFEPFQEGYQAGLDAALGAVFESDPNVMGGELCVRGTRVPKDLVEEELKKDDSPIMLAARFDWQEPLAEIVRAALHQARENIEKLRDN